MKVLVVLAGIVAIGLAESVTLMQKHEVPDEYIKNPRYLLWETEEGLVHVEDLESPEISNSTEVFASERDVSFYIYTPERRLGVEITESQIPNMVRLTGFNVNRPTMVIIHGWQSSRLSNVNRLIRNAVLERHNVNVIVVDWSRIARYSYSIAQGRVLAVGNYIGDALARITRDLNYPLNQFTVAGHSLGAHISGNAGARLGGQLETIVGLDPAGPLFTQRNTDNRLDPTDAKYVHVIHTNDGTLGYGIIMGHVDYFPNGGSSQPGCGIDLYGLCAHSRCYEFYSESISNDRFRSTNCDSYRSYNWGRCRTNPTSLMGGYPVRNDMHGQYYLDTNSRSPFAQG